MKPLKSIGNPATWLFELDSDIAFVMILSNFTVLAHDTKPWWKGRAEATWLTLASLSHEPNLNLPPRIAGPLFANLCDEGIWGLDVAIDKLENVVAAILNECYMMAECLNLHTKLTLKPANNNTLRNNSFSFFFHLSKPHIWKT